MSFDLLFQVFYNNIFLKKLIKFFTKFKKKFIAVILKFLRISLF